MKVLVAQFIAECNEHTTAQLDRIGQIRVRTLAIGANHRRLAHIALAQVTMRVTRHHNGHVRTHDLAHFMQDMMLA